MKRIYKSSHHHETALELLVRFGVIGLMGIFMVVAIIGNAVVQNDSGTYAFVIIILTAIFLWTFTIFAEKTADSYQTWLTIIFIIALLLRMIMINRWAIEPTSDFKDTYKVALALAKSNMSDMKILMASDFHYYYTTWSVHVPFILIKMFILRMCGGSYHSIQVIFNIFSALSCVMTAMIAKSLYGRRAGIIAGFMMCIFPLGLMFSAVLSNQHIATFFFLLAIYILLENPAKQRLLNIALSSVSMTISQLVRPEMLVFIIAVMCYFLYRDILSIGNSREMKAERKKFSGYCIMFLSIYVMIMLIVSLSLSESGLVEKGILTTNYKYKVVTGLNAASNGTWTEEDAQYSDNDEVLDSLIEERSQDLWQVTKLAFTKLGYQYGSYNYYWCISDKSGEFVEHWYGPMTNGVMFIILLLTLLKVIIAFFKKSRRELFLMIMMVGYFLIFTVIEVQNRYNYFAIPIFVIMASGALIYVYETVKYYVCYIVERYTSKKLENK